MKFQGNIRTWGANQIASYVEDTGVANAYVIATRPAVSSYTDGLLVRFIADNGNTGSSTLNVDGLGVITLKKNVNTDLDEGDILPGQVVEAVYDGTNFQVLGIGATGTLTDGIISGGIVTWLQDYDYRISPATYVINGVPYASPETFVTLDPSDPSLDRIDTFIVDTSNSAGVLTGTPMVNPTEPPLDMATQLRLSAAFVGAATTAPDIEVECLYIDDAEWATNPSTIRINPASPNNPDTGTVDIEFTNVINNDYIDLVRSSPEDVQALFTTIIFKIRPKSGWTALSTIKLQWFNGASPVGNIITLGNGDYGLDITDDTIYQYIVIPLGDFGGWAGTLVDTLRIKVDSSVTLAGLYMDNICMQQIELPPSAAILTFQNGLRKFGNIVEHGSPSQYSGPGWLLHDTWLNTGYWNYNISGYRVYNYILNVDQTLSFENGTGIQSWHHFGPLLNTQPDYLNTVKLGINYTSNVYDASPGPDLDGYFGPEDIGYYLSVNITGHGSFGQYTDSILSKIGGIFINTLDNSLNDRSMTFFGDVPSGTLEYHGMDAARIMSLYTNKDLQFYGYEVTRDDGDTLNALYVDSDGMVKHGPIGITGSGPVITADNGLIKDTPTNVQLGSVTPGAGDLLHDTWIDLNGQNLSLSSGINPYFYLDSTNQLGNFGDVNDAFGGPTIFWDIVNKHIALIGSSSAYSSLKLNDVTHITELGNLGVVGNLTKLTIDDDNSITTLTNEFQLGDYGVGTYTGTDTYWLAVDATGNVIEMAAPLAAITADNGLTANTATNIQLGGTLLQNTTINTTSAFTLNVNGTTTTPLAVASTSATGIYSAATSGIAINGTSSSSIGIYGLSTSSYGLVAQSLTSIAGRFQQSTTGTNDITSIIELERGGNGTSANGFGTAITFKLETSPGFSGSLSNQIISKWTTVATASRTSQFIITGVNNAVTSDLLTLSGNGSLKMNKYGVGSFTSGTATYLIATDASGNWFEYPSGGVGAGLVTADNGLSVNSPNNVQLGGPVGDPSELLSHRYIDAGALYSLVLTGTTPSGTADAILIVNNTAGSGITRGLKGTVASSSSSSYGIWGVATGGTGVRGDSTSSTGVYGNSTSGAGVVGVSSSTFGVTGSSASSAGVNGTATGGAAGGIFSTIATSTNTFIENLQINRGVTGTAAAGVGGYLSYNIQANGGLVHEAARIGAVWTDAVTASRSADLQFWTTLSAAAAQKAVLTSTGVLGLGKYSSLTGTRLEVVDDSLAGASMVKLTSTSTAATGSTQKMLEITLSGANANGNQSTYGAYISNTHTSGGVLSINYGLYAEASGSDVNRGVYASGSSQGVYAISNAGAGVYATSTSYYGLQAISGTGRAFQGQITPAGTNDIATHSEFIRSSSGTAANGIGGSIVFQTETTTGSNVESNSLIWKWIDATHASRTSQFDITGVNNATTNTLLTISGAGIFTLTQGLTDYADDSAASAGGIPVNGLYRTASVVKIRVS